MSHRRLVVQSHQSLGPPGWEPRRLGFSPTHSGQHSWLTLKAFASSEGAGGRRKDSPFPPSELRSPEAEGPCWAPGQGQALEYLARSQADAHGSSKINRARAAPGCHHRTPGVPSTVLLLLPGSERSWEEPLGSCFRAGLRLRLRRVARDGEHERWAQGSGRGLGRGHCANVPSLSRSLSRAPGRV